MSSTDKLFLTFEDHMEYMMECVRAKPAHTIFSTYGIYAGITTDGRDTNSWGPKYASYTRDMLELMRKLPNVRILIGVSEFKSCKKNVHCTDCERQYAQNLIRIINHCELFPEFQWRLSLQLHAKCYLFFYANKACGVAGGRNLSDSNWQDISFKLSTDHVKQLFTHVGDIWKSAKEANDQAVSDILDEQMISKLAMSSLVI